MNKPRALGKAHLRIVRPSDDLATNVTFSRGSGTGSPNVVEFDYFPAADIIAATVSPAIISSNNQFATSFTFPLEMTVGDLFQITLRYTASNQTLVTTMTRNGAAFGPVKNVRLGTSFTDFHVDAVSVSSYSDQDDLYGSILVRGVVDNVILTTPPPPVSQIAGHFSNGEWQAQFVSRSNWVYTLERTADFQQCAPAARQSAH